MVDKNEFRLGNFVMDSNSGEWMVVDEIRDEVVVKFVNKDKHSVMEDKKMLPIPITPALLDTRCGFYHPAEEQHDFWLYRVIKFNLSESGMCLWNDEENCMMFGTVPFQYLHQLQNIVFDLTGEELDLKP
jgi:hypothetical protein